MGMELMTMLLTTTSKVHVGGTGSAKKSRCWIRSCRLRRSMAVVWKPGQSKRVVLMAPTSRRRRAFFGCLGGGEKEEEEEEEEEEGVLLRARRPMACRRPMTHLEVLKKETESWEADW